MELNGLFCVWRYDQCDCTSGGQYNIVQYEHLFYIDTISNKNKILTTQMLH